MCVKELGTSKQLLGYFDLLSVIFQKTRCLMLLGNAVHNPAEIQSGCWWLLLNVIDIL